VNAHGHLSSRPKWKPTRPGGQRLSLSVTQLYRRRCNGLFILTFLAGTFFVARFAHWRWTPLVGLFFNALGNGECTTNE
jgi:hypothetical protein